MAICVRDAFEHTPPALDFVWAGLLSGTVGALLAPGGTGKSFWALQAAAAVAGGTPEADTLGLAPSRAGRVIYISQEDPEPVLLHRLFSLGSHLSLNAKAKVAANLEIITHANPNLGALEQACGGRHKPARLIILDTLSKMHLRDENSNSDMAQLMSDLERLASDTGAAILYLHHLNKISMRDGAANQAQAARGASALTDNARWCGNMVPMAMTGYGNMGITEEDRHNYVHFQVSKSNYSPAADKTQWYRRDADGFLLPVRISPLSNPKRKTRDEA